MRISYIHKYTEQSKVSVHLNNDTSMLFIDSFIDLLIYWFTDLSIIYSFIHSPSKFPCECIDWLLDLPPTSVSKEKWFRLTQLLH